MSDIAPTPSTVVLQGELRSIRSNPTIVKIIGQMEKRIEDLVKCLKTENLSTPEGVQSAMKIQMKISTQQNLIDFFHQKLGKSEDNLKPVGKTL